MRKEDANVYMVEIKCSKGKIYLQVAGQYTHHDVKLEHARRKRIKRENIRLYQPVDPQTTQTNDQNSTCWSQAKVEVRSP